MSVHGILGLPARLDTSGILVGVRGCCTVDIVELEVGVTAVVIFLSNGKSDEAS